MQKTQPRTDTDAISISVLTSFGNFHSGFFREGVCGAIITNTRCRCCAVQTAGKITKFCVAQVFFYFLLLYYYLFLGAVVEIFIETIL